MSAINQAIQRVARLDEPLATRLLAWLDTQQAALPAASQEAPLGARAMIGFALRDGRTPRSTADWIEELREGETE